MLKLNGKPVDIGHFPDGTLLLRQQPVDSPVITWQFENNEELVALIFLTQHLKAHGAADIRLSMPYIPNARQDRVKTAEDVFTLKYFAQIINSLGFCEVTVLDPHSSVSEALIDRLRIVKPTPYIERAVAASESADAPLIMFYPDEGAMKRYTGMIDRPYTFGLKKRDWETGEIKGLDAAGMTERIAGSDVLIVDDISSRGGTFYHSAKRLKELGARRIYLFVSHCENTILTGEVLSSGLITRVFTTDSIFTARHDLIEVFHYE